MPISVVVGEQRGDEGKGRFVDMLAAEHDIVARFNGGPNAGHTVILPDGTEYDLHGIPSGIAHPHVMNVIGQGALINCMRLDDEIRGLLKQGVELTPDNFMIDSSAHLILPHHVSEDELREAGSRAQGTTKSGIAPCAADKYSRYGVRAEIINNNPEKLFEVVKRGLLDQRHLRVEERLPNIDEETAAFDYVEAAQRLGPFITDAALYLDNRLSNGAMVLAEAAQALLLDIDSGMYPDVTSSSTTVGGVANGLGIAPSHVDRVLAVCKAIPSHVGGGHSVTEIKEEDNPQLLARLHGDMDAIDAEKGTTTGRVRRLGYFDIPVLMRSQIVNQTKPQGNAVFKRAITKLDWIPRFGEELMVCTEYIRKDKTLRVAPTASYKLRQCKPVYEKLDNWEEDISEIKVYSKLPRAARGFIEFIEERTGVQFAMIGVGPRRDQVIVRDRLCY
jgi:adenylosuccinate synthase